MFKYHSNGIRITPTEYLSHRNIQTPLERYSNYTYRVSKSQKCSKTAQMIFELHPPSIEIPQTSKYHSNVKKFNKQSAFVRPSTTARLKKIDRVSHSSANIHFASSESIVKPQSAIMLKELTRTLRSKRSRHGHEIVSQFPNITVGP